MRRLHDPHTYVHTHRHTYTYHPKSNWFYLFFFQERCSRPLYKVSCITIDPDGRNRAGNFNLARAAESTGRKDRSLGTRATSSFKSAGRNWKRAGQIGTRRLLSAIIPRIIPVDSRDRSRSDQRRSKKTIQRRRDLSTFI